MTRPACLAFSVQVLGCANLKPHDTRRWQSGPHLRVSLGYLCDLLTYLIVELEKGLRRRTQ